MSKKNQHRMMMSGNAKCPIDPLYTGPLEKHHINGREIPNSEKSWNIAYVSPNSHRLIHEGEIILEGWFETSEGRQLIWHHKGDTSFTGREARPFLIRRG